MPVLSTAQKMTLAATTAGAELLQQYADKKAAIVTLKYTGKHRSGDVDAKKHMKQLQKARDGLVAQMHELLKKTRVESLASVGDALGQIVNIAQAAQASVSTAQNTEAVVVSYLYG